ncbi:Heat shock protein Hsp90 [Corchorus capsularis]|uniref:Heat shock protein Hsp90 n=1 Tax=Corchorus capsularis TaxID=210143 RepID=A0A1R3FUE9_COCAP|nr:Heat shock protein Hsp90 [Corchorus capsularis]
MKKLCRGTKITLLMKENKLEHFDKCHLKDLIKKHSEFIFYPISLWIEKATKEKISNDEAEDKMEEILMGQREGRAENEVD